MRKVQVSLSDRVKTIILGSLLGDGSLKIHPNDKNARFSFRRSSQQREYFLWKVRQLKEISSEHCVSIQKPDGLSNQHKFRFQSRALLPLTDLYQLTHRKKSFSIQRKWLNHLTALSLAIWWFDDGSLIGNGRRGVFCTDKFQKDNLKILTRYLFKRWNIHVRLGKSQRIYNGKQKVVYRLWIRSTEELKKFLRIILPHTPAASMLRKVILLYHDSNLQQRWISEVIQRAPFSPRIIQKCYREKLSKLKSLRE